MLAYYRDDERIAMISGDNFQFGRKRGEASYYFSRYNHIWGWASWRRAWVHYDKDATIWPLMRDSAYLNTLIKNPAERRYWSDIFQAMFERKIDTWDYQWALASWSQGMIAIMPSVNLISNIGFGADATHTHGTSIYAAMTTESLAFPLRHPKIILPDVAADDFTARGMFIRSLHLQVMQKIKAMFLRLKA